MHPISNVVGEREAAEYLGLARITLRMQRTRGAKTGSVPKIPFIRMGRAIRYRIKDLEEYLEQHLITA